MALVVNNDKKFNVGSYLRTNAVMILFVLLCIICLLCSGQDLNNVVKDLTGRMGRNVFIVLALIIPVVAGMGINFAITIGAMAAQIACLWTVEMGVGGPAGMALAAVITVPLAAFFGFLIGKLLNKMKGQEMIGGLILGYFANGLYQLLFLFVFGNLIPLKAPGLVIQGSTGVANTIDLSTERGFKYALDNIWKMPLLDALYMVIGIVGIIVVVMMLMKKLDQKRGFITLGCLFGFVFLTGKPFMSGLDKSMYAAGITGFHVILFAAIAMLVIIGIVLLAMAVKKLPKKTVLFSILAIVGVATVFIVSCIAFNRFNIFISVRLTLFLLFALIAIAIAVLMLTKVISRRFAIKGMIGIGVLFAIFFPNIRPIFANIEAPMMTFTVVGLLCLFNTALLKTRLGQKFRAVGQNRTVANASGINVDRVRVIAIMISTVLAGWGQLIFVQNMGSFQTYGAHEQVGLYAGAAILVGGASIRKATNTQAILGCILFHLMFIVVPDAGKVLFGDAAIGEYFRVFISYGVIALALVMHAWSGIQKKKGAKEALSVR